MILLFRFCPTWLDQAVFNLLLQAVITRCSLEAAL